MRCLQADVRALSAVYGSFGDVFGAVGKEKEEQIIKLVKGVAEQTAERGKKELRLLPYRS